MKSSLLGFGISILISCSVQARPPLLSPPCQGGDTGVVLRNINDTHDESILLSDTKSFFRDAGTIFTSPFHFEKKEWLETGTVVAGTALLFTIDNTARPLAQRNHSQLGDNVFNIGREYGRTEYGLILSAGLYAGGFVFDKHELRLTGLELFESLAFAGIVTNVLKVTVGRSRPFVGNGHFDFHPFSIKDEHASFPSGHSTVAFAVSSVLSSRLNNTWASVGLYSLATLTALSRVYHDEHWISDTFIGAAIGNTVGIAVVHLHKHEEQQTSLRVVPSVNGLRVEMLY